MPELIDNTDVDASIYDQLLGEGTGQQARFVVLLDPDEIDVDRLPSFLNGCVEAGVDAFFVGGSLLHRTELDRLVERIQSVSSLPIIGFPGSLSQLSPHLDAVLYLSVISGRNPEYLFGQHVYAAPLIQRMELEPIATGYMLVESGRATTAQYMSNSKPLPRHKPEIAAATGLAAEMMGMKCLYADGGSGAEKTVPDEMIAAIHETCSIPLIVGGGISSPEEVERKVRAGADVVVVGHAFEQDQNLTYVAEMAAAAHGGVTQSV